MARAGTLKDVREHGALRCGVSTGSAGFDFTDDSGNWTGFDPAICQAVAAVFGDPARVENTPTTGNTHVEAPNSGQIDILAWVTTWIFTRDVDLRQTLSSFPRSSPRRPWGHWGPGI